MVKEAASPKPPKITREQGKCQLLEAARDATASIHETMTPEKRKGDKHALQDYLCEYFSGGSCTHKVGKSISPMGATKAGGKKLKVRWLVPGQGKSGGLRLA